MIKIIRNHFSKVIFLSALLVLASFSFSSAVENNHNSSRSNKTYPIASGGRAECVKKGGTVIEKKDKNGKSLYYCHPKKDVGIKEEGVK